MIISSRLNKILDICLVKNDYITVQELSEILHISTRTIFREIKEIDYIFKSFELILISKAKKGIYIEGSIEEKNKLLHVLRLDKVEYLNKEDRRNLLIFEILRSKEIQKLYYYSSMFKVSEATISNDLEVIEKWFNTHQLQFNRKQGIGIELEGSEEHYRRALSLIVEKNIHDEESIYMYDSKNILEQIFFNDKQGIMKLLNQEIVEQILTIFDLYRSELQLNRYAQSSYIGLIIHLSVAIDRIIKNEEIEESEYLMNLIEHQECYQLAIKMVKLLEKKFKIKIPKQETAFIAIHIQSAKLAKENNENELEDILYEKELMGIIRDMIHSFKSDVNLYEDQELISGLLAHLKPTMIRLKNNLPIFNPLLNDLKLEYKQLFEETYRVCRMIQDKYHLKMDENEVGFITMHFGAAIERNKNAIINNTIVRIGVICSSGIGVSALLSARMKKLVDPYIEIEALSIDDLNSGISQWDILVSTFEISQIVKDYIQVNPLLTQKDIEAIQNEIKVKRKHISATRTYNEKDLLVINELTSEMLYLLDHLEVGVIEQLHSKEELFIYASKMIETIQTSQNKILNELLVRENKETTLYSEYGFGLLHTKTNEIEHSMIKVIQIKNSEIKALENIEFVLVMLIREDADHRISKMMGCIPSSLVEDEYFVSLLKKQGHLEIRNYMESILKKHLYNYM